MSPFTRRVWSIVRRVPRGCVVSYGAVAALAGAPRAARAVGRVMAALPDDSDVPWWRVINGSGGISTRPAVHGPLVQRALLEREGVRFDRHGRIDWHRFGWTPEGAPDPDDARPARAVKRSAALVIHDPGGTGRILLVRRPPDDEDLPRAWGLPAATLRAGETWEQAARRAAREKLGVVVRLRGLRNEGTTERPAGRLRMRLFDATLVRGTPDPAGAPAAVTRYTEWRWGDEAALRPAARRGSLCCRLALDSAVTRAP